MKSSYVDKNTRNSIEFIYLHIKLPGLFSKTTSFSFLAFGFDFLIMTKLTDNPYGLIFSFTEPLVAIALNSLRRCVLLRFEGR